MRTRRLAAAASLAALAALTLASCTPGAAASETAAAIAPELGDDQRVEIVFESYNLSQAGAWTDTVQQLIAEFEAAHPNISVTGQAPQGTSAANSSYTSSVQTQLLAGDPPDVAQLTFDSLEFAATQLGAKPLSDIVSAEELEAAFGGEHPMHPNARVLADWDGKTIGMPYVFSTPVLFFNADALAAAGIEDPDFSTWDSVEAIAQQVTAATGKPSLDVNCVVTGGNWCMQGLFRSNGAQVLSDDRSTIEFGSEQAVDTVERFARMTEDGVLRNVDAAAQMEGLAKGDVAMVLTTSAVQGMLLQGAEAGGWTLDAAAMPGFGDAEAVPTNSGSALFVLSEDPAEQRASWEFIEFMTSDRAYELITSQIGYLPLRPSLTEEGGALADWLAANPLAQPNLDQLDRLEPWVSYPGNSYAQVDELLAEAIENVVFYGEPAEETMRDAAERAQALIE
ncbi:extracellular solute-binding protein [Leucobacter allii]|uniref:Extracellular solute-binding protein n=1 Tax=Leucobacter allii TaxID=2932247 RepID=A0ABY4FKM0_9MICO|nr:extracellular solute-binding protein [Leucobacter allii]UOQ56636.1 extracellular solute-binding protein [Leucobacter allii]